MSQYKIKEFIEDILVFPEQKLNNLKDMLDELSDDLYEADDLENDKDSIEKSIKELQDLILLLQEHIELKKDKNCRLTNLEKLYLELRNSK